MEKPAADIDDASPDAVPATLRRVGLLPNAKCAYRCKRNEAAAIIPISVRSVRAIFTAISSCFT
jgi:hypothetical protein